MKYLKIGLLFLTICVSQLIAQGETNYNKEDSTTFRQLKCGLWISNKGDIAVKDIAAPPPDLDCLDFIDYYIYTTYNGLDSINEYVSELKNIVDTNTFEFIGDFYFKDKNHVYILNPMATGGYLVVNHSADVKTFKALNNPFYACDKNDCYVLGRQIDEADPETFKVVPCGGYLLSRDKNNYYHWADKISYDEFVEIEKETIIQPIIE